MTSIGECAFENCSFCSVTIPESVTSIEHRAFYSNYLTTLKVKWQIPPAIDENTFPNRADIFLFVPRGCVAAYEAADYWNQFKEIIEFENNEIYMTDAEGVTGKQMILPIALKNEDEITGLQIDLYLPEGMTVAKNSRGKLKISVTERMDGNYTVTGQEMEGGFVRITGISPDNDAFTGNDGDILTVAIDIAENVPAGDYTIEIKDVVLSDIKNTENHPTDAEATIKIYSLGDADGSGAVNINDAVCIVNHILNRETGKFLDNAADVDGSGSININDVVVLIDRFILHRNNAPLRTSRMMASDTEITDYLYLDELDIMPGETVEVAVKLSNTHEVRAVQGNIKLPEGFSFVTKSNGRLDVKNLNDRSEDFTLSCALQEDGSMTFTQYSIDGYSYEGNDGGIFTFKVTADDSVLPGIYRMALTGVVLSIEGVACEQPDFFGSIIADPDGIGDIKANNETMSVWYDLSGLEILNCQSSMVNGKMPKGINIIRYPDGTSKKVLVK